MNIKENNKNKHNNNITAIFAAILIIGFIFLLLIPNSSALIYKQSNESIAAKELLVQSEKDISEMVSKNIPINRVNESYQEALQIYAAQLALEERGGKANYKVVIKDTSDISEIKNTAIKANDELNIFKESYENIRKDTNLSEMEDEYAQIILSFKEERFEETLELIDSGYDKLSELQSSQTGLKLFYLTTTRTIRNFLEKNWQKILIISLILIVLFLIFQNTLKKLRMRLKLNHLTIQKKAVKGLIKDLQTSYFKSRKISEMEYKIKLNKFEELIRDIDRQVMVLEEELFKLKRKK